MGPVKSKDVLAIHLNRIWETLQSRQAEVTREIKFSILLSLIQNSKYFIAKSQQTLLTREIGSDKTGNFRCIFLDLKEIEKSGQLSEVIHYAKEYERNK
jgi:hypothetical protein